MLLFYYRKLQIWESGGYYVYADANVHKLRESYLLSDVNIKIANNFPIHELFGQVLFWLT